MKKIKVTQVKSQIGCKPRQRATLVGLGLRKIGQSREHQLTDQIKGMLRKVDFLVKVEEVA